MTSENQIVENVKNMIFTIRGQKVMIDRDLAMLYEVETKKLNQSVKRNIERFPNDFMFQLSNEEQKELVTNCDRFATLKHSTSNAYAFTEHGVTMLSSILKSKKAIEINIQVVRAFIALRQYALLQNSKSQEVEELKKMLLLHIENSNNKFSQHDKAINQIINVLNNLIENPRKPNKIGFNIED